MKTLFSGNYIAKTWLEDRLHERENNPVGVYTDKSSSNFLRLDDNVTINALDDIIESSKLVYGPYGGWYGESIGSIELQDVSDDMIFAKSKDGHSYLMAQRYDHTVDDAVLTMIKQYTKFISEFRNTKSSKDGTTSLAILSASLAKSVLMARVNNRKDKEKYMQVPLSVESYMFNMLSEEGTKLVDKYRYRTYDPEKREYTENGFEYNLSAIKTTVDSNPLLVDGFEKLMKRVQEDDIDVTSAFIGQIANRRGDSAFEIEVKQGIKMRAEPLNNAFSSYSERLSPVFILQGNISPEHKEIFERAFTKWLKTLVNQVNPVNGKSFFDPTDDYRLFGQPMFLMTAPNGVLKDIIFDLHKTGIKLDNTQDQSGARISVRPLFMHLYTDSIFADRYTDIKEILGDNVIDLTMIDRFIASEAMKNGVKYIDPVKGTKIEAVPFEKVYEADFYMFPSLDLLELTYKKFKPLTYTKLWDDYKDFEANFAEGNMVEVDKTAEIVEDTAEKFLCINSYDGNSFYLAPTEDSQIATMKVVKQNLDKEIKNSKSSLSRDDNFVRRVEALSSVSIYPIIYARTNDEATLMQTLYEDAIGVFASVHVHGVMPGGNIGFIKFFNEFSENVLKRVDEEFIKPMNLKENHRYIKFLKTLLVSIKYAYGELFINLFPSRDEGLQRLADLRTFNKKNPDKFILAYDIIRGEYNNRVFEAAQTTIDNFYCALSFTKDLLDLKTIKFKPGHASAHPQYRIVDGGPLHPRNKEIAPKVNKLNKLEK